jgi:hypothetical protein
MTMIGGTAMAADTPIARPMAAMTATGTTAAGTTMTAALTGGTMIGGATGAMIGAASGPTTAISIAELYKLLNKFEETNDHTIPLS